MEAQKSVVLRFVMTLAGGARQTIYRRILEEGRLQREINDRMSRTDRTHVSPCTPET